MIYRFVWFFFRKEGGKFGFAESMPKERITTLKREEAPVEMTDVKETANDIVTRTETSTEAYLIAYSMGTWGIASFRTHVD